VTDTGTVTATEWGTSADGTRIAFERAGTGPVLVLIDGGFCYREFGPARDVAKALFAVTRFSLDGARERYAACAAALGLAGDGVALASGSPANNPVDPSPAELAALYAGISR